MGDGVELPSGEPLAGVAGGIVAAVGLIGSPNRGLAGGAGGGTGAVGGTGAPGGVGGTGGTAGETGAAAVGVLLLPPQPEKVPAINNNTKQKDERQAINHKSKASGKRNGCDYGYFLRGCRIVSADFRGIRVGGSDDLVRNGDTCRRQDHDSASRRDAYDAVQAAARGLNAGRLQ